MPDVVEGAARSEHVTPDPPFRSPGHPPGHPPSAHGIWSDGSAVYIAGFGIHSSDGLYSAMLWSQPVPEPATALGLFFGFCLVRRRQAQSRKVRRRLAATLRRGGDYEADHG